MAKQNAVPGPGRNQGHERRLVGVVDDQQLPALVVEGHFIDPLDPAGADHVDDLPRIDIDDLERAVAIAGIKAVAVGDHAGRSAGVVAAGEALEAADAGDELVGPGVENVDAGIGAVRQEIEPRMGLHEADIVGSQGTARNRDGSDELDAVRARGPRAESCGEKYGGCDRETGRSARVHDVSSMESRSGEAPGPPEDRAAICNDLLTPLPAAWSVRTTAFKPGFSFCDSDESLTKYFADRAGYTVGTVIVPQRRGAYR